MRSFFIPTDIIDYRAFLILAILICSCETEQRSADTIILAPTYTMNNEQSWAEAVVIKDDKIIYVGDKDKALSYGKNTTKIIKRPDGMVLPGFIDSHVHLLWGGIEMSECQLSGLETPEKILGAIKDYVISHPDNDWIRGYGWDLTAFPDGNPRKEWLDDISPDRPVFLYAYDAHSVWVNSKALSLAGVTSNTSDPENGHIERDPITGEPSGVLRENAMELVKVILPSYDKDEIEDGLKLAMDKANRLGITSVFDAGTGPHDGLMHYLKESRNRSTTLRISASQYAYPNSWRNDLEKIKKLRYENEFGFMNTVKIFADGTIEGGSAALNDPYEGTNERGMLIWDPDTLNEMISEFEKNGFQIHVHAIGDRGVRTTLDAFEHASTMNGLGDRRHMISHVQLVHPNDVSRFKDLNVIASFQALWAYPDQYMKKLTLPVLGPIRSNWNYPINSIYSSGGRIVGGSDWTVSSMNPLHAIEVAITRRELGNKDGEVLNPSETVSLETILHSYTKEAAFGIFLDDKIGSLEIGKLADVIILNRNLFEIPKHKIHEVLVETTIFNGRIIHDNYLLE